MNRLGWTILALLVLGGIALATMVHLGSGQLSSPQRLPTPVPASGSRVLRPARSTATGTSGLVIPVAGVAAPALHDDWGEPRGDGTRAHHAIDIMAPKGTPVLAAASGRIEKLFESVPGGHTVYVRSEDGGTVYYYAHLDGYWLGLHEGQPVLPGERIAFVGATGDADPGAPHLHFEVKRMAAGERWWQGTNVDPYPLLIAGR